MKKNKLKCPLPNLQGNRYLLFKEKIILSPFVGFIGLANARKMNAPSLTHHAVCPGVSLVTPGTAAKKATNAPMASIPLSASIHGSISNA